MTFSEIRDGFFRNSREQNIKLLWGKNKLVGQKMQHEFFKTLCAAFHSNMVSGPNF